MRTSANVGRAVGLAAGLGSGAAVFCRRGRGMGGSGRAPGFDVAFRRCRAQSGGEAGTVRRSRAIGSQRRSGGRQPTHCAETCGCDRGRRVGRRARLAGPAKDDPSLSRDAIAGTAARYVDSGRQPADSARFFFGDLAVTKFGRTGCSQHQPRPGSHPAGGNLAVSGYFGGIWLRDNLRDNPLQPPRHRGASAQTANLTASAVAIRFSTGSPPA